MNTEPTNGLRPQFFSSNNLSHAWGSVFLHMMTPGVGSLSPLVVSITDFQDNGLPYEDAKIHDALDTFLDTQKKMNSIEVTAFTIFPQSFWEIADGDRSKFYEMCSDAVPRLKKRDRRNRKGLYFERLFEFEGKNGKGNQIEFMIQNYRQGVRASMLQAVVYDPKRDKTRSALLGFPCLQSVSFVPANEGLVVNAVYPTQYLIERAYGNFLGISQLGAFVAKGFGTKLAQVNINVGVESRYVQKGKLKGLQKVVASATREAD